MNLSLAEKLILLVINEATGKLDVPDRLALNVALGGAVLLDLSLRNRIDTDRNRLWVVDNTPTGNSALDTILAMIDKEDVDLSIQNWVYIAYKEATDVRNRILAGLVRKKIVRPEVKKFLWFFNFQRFRPQNAEIERETKRRIMDVLFDNKVPLAEDVALVALCDAANLFPALLSNRQLESSAPRIQQVARMELITQSVCAVIGEVYTAMSRASFY